MVKRATPSTGSNATAIDVENVTLSHAITHDVMGDVTSRQNIVGDPRMSEAAFHDITEDMPIFSDIKGVTSLPDSITEEGITHSNVSGQRQFSNDTIGLEMLSSVNVGEALAPSVQTDPWLLKGISNTKLTINCITYFTV